MILQYEPAARAEAVQALRWYADVAGASIVDAFEYELDSAIQLLLRFPRLGSPGVHGSRKLRADRFPYTLHYRLDGELIRILAVANQRRRPGYWRGR